MVLNIFSLYQENQAYLFNLLRVLCQFGNTKYLRINEILKEVLKRDMNGLSYQGPLNYFNRTA